VDLRAVAAVFAYRPFRILVALFFMQEVGAGMTGASIAFFLTYNLKMTNALGNLGVISLLAGVVVIMASPMWIYVSHRIGKSRSYILGATAHGLLMLFWGLSSPHTPVWIIFAFSAAIGLANSGWGIMALALLGEIIASSIVETGENRGGSFSAVWTLAEKIGLALGATLIAGTMLSGFGFSSAIAAHGRTEPDSALLGIALTFGFIPAAINGAAALLYWRGRTSLTQAPPYERIAHDHR
jgi:Na+/melibiose symporter-like transporter